MIKKTQSKSSKSLVKEKKVTPKVSPKKIKPKAVAPKTISKKSAVIKKVAAKVKPTKSNLTKIVIKKEIKEKKIGRVLNYFDKIKVIAIKLKDDLSIGDTIRIKGGVDTDFKQKITSMEKNGEKIKNAKKNQGIGFKVKEKVRAGYWVYKVMK